jgi:hypothetical protein
MAFRTPRTNAPRDRNHGHRDHRGGFQANTTNAIFVANLPAALPGSSLADELRAFFGTQGHVVHVQVAFHGGYVIAQ